MITVEVVSISGMPPPRPMSVRVDEQGATLGRSPDCSLVLSDEKRAVSRIHGQVHCVGGHYEIEDQGTNPLKVNGMPLGKGNRTPIRSGDRIVIGPYELAVRGAAAAAPAIEPASTNTWSPDISAIFAAAPSPPPSAAAPAPGSSNPFDDLFGALSAGAAPALGSNLPSGAPSDALFADLDFGAPASAPSPFPPPPSATPSASAFGGALPDDFDPMAPPASAAPPDALLAPAAGALPDDAFGGLISSPQAPGEGSLDALFGLSSGSSPDPFASGPLGKPAPSHAGGTDSGLTQWLGGINKSAAAAVPDKVPELNSAYQPPKAVSAPAAAPRPLLDDFAAPASAAPLLPSAGELPDFDLDAFGAAPAPAAIPEPPRAPAPAVARPVPPPRPAAAPPAMPAPRPRAATASAASAASGDLLQALLEGLNAQDLVIDELTPELMYKFGRLMHEATAGTVALLGARGTVKREMRADVTMIASGRNNPLKFSPDARLALRYLFGPQMPGFMEGEEAMRDAYADLRAHEFGFMAGLRAALSGVLKRFEPGALEARLPDKGGLNALLPMNRKAKLWELFSELYRQIALEAEEDFHALFGREFLRAYEEHIAALDRQRRQ